MLAVERVGFLVVVMKVRASSAGDAAHHEWLEIVRRMLAEGTGRDVVGGGIDKLLHLVVGMLHV